MNQVVEGFMSRNNKTDQSVGRDSGEVNGTPITVHGIVMPEFDQPQADGVDQGVSRTRVVDDFNPLHQIKAKLQVCVGEATVSVGELLAAKENQVLQLNRTFDQPVDLMLEGKVIARGQLVAIDNYFAVRITDLPFPLRLATE